jgi:hypothetical protein
MRSLFHCPVPRHEVRSFEKRWCEARFTSSHGFRTNAAEAVAMLVDSNRSQGFKEGVMRHVIRSFWRPVALVVLTSMAITPSRSQVNVQLGGGIGIAIPSSDFSGSTQEYYNGSRYGLGSGLNLHGKAKISWSAWNIAGEIDYSSFHNTGYSEPAQGAVDISQHILSVKAGPELRIGVLELPVVSYIGANIAMNRFAGETKFQGVSKVPSGTYSLKPTTRFGIGLSAGSEVAFGPYLSLDFNVSYNVMNAFGKEWDDGNPATAQRIDSYLSLNDATDPQHAPGDDKHFVSHERTISTIQFTVSVLFGL